MPVEAHHGVPWRDRPAHRRWLEREADALLSFFEPELIDASGGFAVLDNDGRAVESERVRPLHVTTRMVHCFSIAHLMGRPGAADFIDHGMKAIRTRHRDSVHGGYFWSFDANGPRERDKLAYGHAFVLLAASSAKLAGHAEADALLADVTDILETRFWDKTFGVSAEEFREDWSSFSTYRGQNSNMHLCEALMAAFEATRERLYLDKARSIADRIVLRNAGGADWRVPEHFHADWTPDPAYKGDDVFRPQGFTPGHALEWARLTLQLRALDKSGLDWAVAASRQLFRQAIAQGWDQASGGFYYTTNEDGSPRIKDRLWWPCCEGIGAAHYLGVVDGGAFHETWYRRIWDFTERHFIDARAGGWRAHLDDELRPIRGYFVGKQDLYHALQACLIPRFPTSKGLARAAADGTQ